MVVELRKQEQVGQWLNGMPREVSQARIVRSTHLTKPAIGAARMVGSSDVIRLIATSVIPGGMIDGV